jgi:hypothetical protein
MVFAVKWVSRSTSRYCSEKPSAPTTSPNLGQLSERIIGFQDRYNTTATPFDWTYTRDDLNAFLHRLDLHDTPHTPAHAA